MGLSYSEEVRWHGEPDCTFREVADRFVTGGRQ